MQQEFTRQFMLDNSGCYSYNKLMSMSFMKEESISLESILDSEIPLKDKFWFVCKILATKEENQKIAIGVAEIVLPIFENSFPSDDRPRKAIEAAKQFISGHISFNAAARAAYAAADAATRAAAAAARAAAAAARAAAAADAADADAAADAAAAAAAAADAATYAAAYDDINTELMQFLKDISLQ